jgi:hypothetical protein
MIYLYILSIRGWDWPDKVNLCVSDREPTQEEKKEIIQDYWNQYEQGAFEEFEKFHEYLIESELKDNPYKKGIWTEKIALLANKERLIKMFDSLE